MAKQAEKAQQEEALPCGVTKVQITQWKNRWGEVHLIQVPVDEAGHDLLSGYFRKPDLDVISAAAKFQESDPLKSGIIMFTNCWLAGDDALKEDEEAKMSCIVQLGKLFKIRAASIKKL